MFHNDATDQPSLQQSRGMACDEITGMTSGLCRPKTSTTARGQHTPSVLKPRDFHADLSQHLISAVEEKRGLLAVSRHGAPCAVLHQKALPPQSYLRLEDFDWKKGTI